jgi:hypothetical protein
VLDEDDPQTLTSLPVKHAGVAIPNPVKSPDMNYEVSIIASLHLIIWQSFTVSGTSSNPASRWSFDKELR